MRSTSLGNEITGLRSTDTGTYKTKKVGRKKVLVMGYSILRAQHGPRVSAYVLPLQWAYSTNNSLAKVRPFDCQAMLKGQHHVKTALK